MRKGLIISGIIILLGLAAYLVYVFFPEKQTESEIQVFESVQNPAYKAVPLKSLLAIEIRDQNKLVEILKSNTAAIKEIMQVDDLAQIASRVINHKRFIEENQGLNRIFKGKSVIISVNQSGRNQLGYLYIVQLNSSESGSACAAVSDALINKYKITQRNYDNTVIYNASFEKENIYYAVAGDIFLISKDFLFIEEAIRQTRSINLLSNSDFTNIYKTIDENAALAIFINHRTASLLLNKIVSAKFKKSTGLFSNYTSWSYFKLNYTENEISLNGYSMTNDSSDFYLNSFRSQSAGKISIDKLIPSNASSFFALKLDNTSKFIDQNENYLRAKGNFFARENILIDFTKKTKLDAVKLIKETEGSQFACVYTDINKSNPIQNRFFIAEISNTKDLKEKLQKAANEFSKFSKNTGAESITIFEANSKNKFNIYRLPFGNVAESLFGSAFVDINAEYCALYDKYLICGDNISGLKSYLAKLVSGKTMANDSVYNSYSNRQISKLNFSMYSKVSKVLRLNEYFLSGELGNKISKYEDIFNKFSYLSFQFAIEGDLIKNTIALKYDPLIKEEPSMVWRQKFEGDIAAAPKFVLNHRDLPNREIIVRDKKNNITLIDKGGNILWTVNIQEEIISEIYQIDLFRNNKYQYAFNTKTQLWVLDRMGNKVGKFPATLKSVASGALSVIYSGKNKELRFIVPGSDKKLYAFDNLAKPLQKWEFEGTETPVISQIRQTVVDEKETIYFADKNNIYIIDRNGKSTGIETKKTERSANELLLNDGKNPVLIWTDTSGKVYTQFFSGESEIFNFGKFSPAHGFTASDLDDDGTLEYIFTESKKLSVFGSDGRKIFDRSFGSNITETPFIVTIANSVIKIAIVTGSENKVYLIDRTGAITKGFPLEGKTPFAFGKFNDSNNWYNLVTGYDGASLVNYRVEF